MVSVRLSVYGDSSCCVWGEAEHRRAQLNLAEVFCSKAPPQDIVDDDIKN